MQILGNRVLVRKCDEEKKEGFQTVDVNDPFLNKGIIEEISFGCAWDRENIGKTILFAKYSPDTHDYEDKKIVSVDDILAIL